MAQKHHRQCSGQYIIIALTSDGGGRLTDHGSKMSETMQWTVCTERLATAGLGYPTFHPRLLAVTDNAVNSMCGETISKSTRRSPNTLPAVMGRLTDHDSKLSQTMQGTVCMERLQLCAKGRRRSPNTLQVVIYNAWDNIAGRDCCKSGTGVA